MENHTAMSLSEYQSAYAEAVGRLLETSKSNESGTALPDISEEMRAMHREISGIRLNDGDHFVLAKDRLALVTRILRQDFNRWFEGLVRNAQNRPENLETARLLESEIEKLAEEIQAISLELESGKQNKHDHYTALMEKYIEKYNRKLQYLNSPQPATVNAPEEAISGLNDFLVYLKDCLDCLKTPLLLQTIYEKNYGSKVVDLSQRFKKQKDVKSRSEFAEEVNLFYKSIKSISQRQSSFAPALRDHVILCAWRLQVELSKWRMNMEYAQDRLVPHANERDHLIAELEKLRLQIDELEGQLNRGNHTLINRYNDLTEKYNQKLRSAKSLDEEIVSTIRKQVQTIEEVVINAQECQEPLSQLNACDDNAAKQKAAMELQKAVMEIFILDDQLGDHQAYRNLKQKCEELQKQIKELWSGSDNAIETDSAMDDATFDLNDADSQEITFQTRMLELERIFEELRQTMTLMSSLPDHINGIDQFEDYREFKRHIDRVKETIEGLFSDIPLSVPDDNSPETDKPAAEMRDEAETVEAQTEAIAAEPPASGEDGAPEDEQHAAPPSPGQHLPAELPEDVPGFIEYLKRCESEEDKAAAREQVQQWREEINTASTEDENDSTDDVKSLRLEIRKFRLTLMDWIANLDSLLGTDIFGKVQAHQEKLSGLQQKIADHRAKLNSPNYSDARKKRFEMALARHSKDYERGKETAAELRTELEQVFEPCLGQLSRCSGVLDACKKLFTGLAEPDRREISEELADALSEIRFIELWCKEQAGIGDLLKNHSAYRRLLQVAGEVGEILKENSPDIALSLPELPDAAGGKAGQSLMEKDGQVLKTVKQLRDRLRDRLTGHTIAYKHLLNGDDQTVIDTLHHDLAEEEWLKIYKENPQDWIACHHLAILYHAKAFDLEMEGNEQEAEKAWENALKYWQKMIEQEEPLKSIRALLQNMDRYKEAHDKELVALNTKIIYDLLAIHHRFYDHYISRKDEDRAERHYSILEKVPLEEKQPILQSIYEKNYGSKVADLSKRFKNKKDVQTRSEFSEEVNRFYKRIKSISKKRLSLAPALRDLVMLCGLRLQIELSKWRINQERVIDRLTPLTNERDRLISEMERLRPMIDELESQLNRGNHTIINRYRDLIEKHNQKVHRFNTLNEKISNEFRQQVQTIEDLVINARECEEPLSQLIACDDNAAKQKAAMELQEAVTEIFLLENQLGDHQAYRNLKQKCEELQKKIKALRATLPVAAQAAAVLDNQANLWNWVEFKKEENPYANTAFLLLQTELPALTETIDIQKLLIRMRQKTRNLEKMVRAGRHLVLGRKVSREELNKALAKLDSPLQLAKDMLLQHQAHPLDAEDIKAQLEEIELPSPDRIPVEISRGIFTLFTVPALPEGAMREWKKPGNISPGEITKPRIQWPT